MLEQIRGPADLQHLSQSQLSDLAQEIREFLIHKVAATGGHLGPNLGVVELTLALHRVFDSPHDPIIFDTGHQAYVHKMLTGRSLDFDTLRKKGGLSGYPSRDESEHDWVESSHASSALSYADGLAKAFELSGHRNRHVVAVVGDGALTGGMCWEALNNIAAARRPVVIVVNDNGRSYAPTIGGFAEHLAGLRLQPGYEKVLDEGKRALRGVPLVGELCYQCLHSVKAGIKDALSPQVMFTDLGLKYVGPIDGHDEHAVENALRNARGFNAPVIVHVVTRKGMGYPPAENDEDDQMHSCGVIDPETGLATSMPGPGWTSTFSEALIAYGAKRRDIVAITAAMPGPTGLSAFRQRFPDRFFDVGIAEQHAMTSAAGLAMGGLHPVVAIYSTFLNRAFDQVMMDVALHKLPVTMVLDRSGVSKRQLAQLALFGDPVVGDVDVGEGLVGVLDELLGQALGDQAVGMMLAHQPAINLAHLVVAHIARQAQHRIRVGARHLACSGREAAVDLLERGLIETENGSDPAQEIDLGTVELAIRPRDVEQPGQKLPQQVAIALEQHGDLVRIGFEAFGRCLGLVVHPRDVADLVVLDCEHRRNARISSRVTRPSALESLAASAITAVANAIRRVSAGSS